MNPDENPQGEPEVSPDDVTLNEKHLVRLEELEKKYGEAPALLARIGCAINAIHMSTTLQGDTEQAQMTKQSIYGDIMSQLDKHLGCTEEESEVVARAVVDISNELAEYWGFAWTLDLPAPDPVLLDSDMVRPS